jgi:hypothetical protein
MSHASAAQYGGTERERAGDLPPREPATMGSMVATVSVSGLMSDSIFSTRSLMLSSFSRFSRCCSGDERRTSATDAERLRTSASMLPRESLLRPRRCFPAISHQALGSRQNPQTKTEILVWGRCGPILKFIVCQDVSWRATVDEDGHYCFAVPL